MLYKKLISFVLLLILLTGCAQNKSGLSDSQNDTIPDIIQEDIDSAQALELDEVQAITPEPRYGGRLRLSMRLPLTFNPILNTDSSVDKILDLMYEKLFVLDDEQEPVPNLAESYAMSDDKLQMTVKLRSDAYWNDGNVVTAHDLAYTIDCLKAASADVIYKDSVKNIDSCKAFGDYEAVIYFNVPQTGFFMYSLCFPVIPMHYYKNNSKSNPVCGGVYDYEEYKSGNQLTLRASNTTFKKKPYITFVDVLITSDLETDIGAFDNSLIDAVSISETKRGKFRGNKEINSYDYLSTYFDMVGFNFDDKMISDLRVRQAVAACVPVDEIITDVYLNHSQAANAPISPESWLYDNSVKTPSFDLERAKELFKSVMDERKSSEGDNKDTLFSLSILVNSENAERVKIANIIAANMREAGIIAYTEKVSFDIFEERIKNGYYQICISGYDLSTTPDFGFMFRSDSGVNYSRYKDSRLDILFDIADSAVTDKSLKTSMSNICVYLNEQLVCVSLAFRTFTVATNKNVYGYINPYPWNIFYNLNRWYIFDTSQQ